MISVCHFCEQSEEDCTTTFDGFNQCPMCSEAETRAKWAADDARREARETAWAEMDARFERDGRYVAPSYPDCREQAESQRPVEGWLRKRQAGS